MAAVVAVKFGRFARVVSENMNVRRSRSGHRGAEVVDQQRLEIKGGFPTWHGVGLNGYGTVAVHVGERPIDPGLQTESVVKEHISLAESNQVRGGWFVVVDGDVHGTHHFN